MRQGERPVSFPAIDLLPLRTWVSSSHPALDAKDILYPDK